MDCEVSRQAGEELQLLRAWRGGDRAAAGVLYTRHAPEVQRYFRRREPEHGADLVQETFMALLRPTTSEPRSVRGYVLAIARNILCRHLQRAYKRRQERADYVDACVRGSTWTTPAAALEEAERRAAWDLAVRGLSAEERRILQLRYVEGLSVEEAARRVDLAPTTFPGRALRAKQRLRRALPPELLGRDRGCGSGRYRRSGRTGAESARGL